MRGFLADGNITVGIIPMSATPMPATPKSPPPAANLGLTFENHGLYAKAVLDRPAKAYLSRSEGEGR